MRVRAPELLRLVFGLATDRDQRTSRIDVTALRHLSNDHVAPVCRRIINRQGIECVSVDLVAELGRQSQERRSPLVVFRAADISLVSNKADMLMFLTSSRVDALQHPRVRP